MATGIKVTFKLIAAHDVNTINEVVNKHLAEGWKFMTGSTLLINKHETIAGKGYQYSITMLLEEEY